jgi:hypothetical protein
VKGASGVASARLKVAKSSDTVAFLNLLTWLIDGNFKLEHNNNRLWNRNQMRIINISEQRIKSEEIQIILNF